MRNETLFQVHNLTTATDSLVVSTADAAEAERVQGEWAAAWPSNLYCLFSAEFRDTAHGRFIAVKGAGIDGAAEYLARPRDGSAALERAISYTLEKIARPKLAASDKRAVPWNCAA
jgi:hypothetical protein